MKVPTFIIIALGVLMVGWFLTRSDSKKIANQENSGSSEPVEIIARDLDVPWALAFLPDNSILLTERKGTVRLVTSDGKLEPNSIATINVKQTGESGLHGIAVDPDFSKNHFVYLYYTYSGSSDQTLNRVSQFKYENKSLTGEKVLVDKIPGAIFHDGGRIKFGPDGYLYITTGDALNPSLAQDKNSLAGKILRYKDEKVEVYSYGHRNPQGIAWDSNGNLFETEHGNSATDEFNQIQQGANYGWPDVTGSATRAGINSPILQSGSETWAPAGIAFYNGSFYFGGLRGQALYQIKLEGAPRLVIHFKGEYGRIRDVVLGPDNMLYITTSNRDGRGTVKAKDDKIIRVNTSNLH
ncbi:PQQ-dependent sugar dehydrogenase [Candidatus Microgenomates bacterium]|nr:PQQ-dependent sugar dehydrogenase [Candidatus Microgenomates bacterium]